LRKASGMAGNPAVRDIRVGGPAPCFDVDNRSTLLDALRAGTTPGQKRNCERGRCGEYTHRGGSSVIEHVMRAWLPRVMTRAVGRRIWCWRGR